MEHDFAVKSLAAERYQLGEMQPEEQEDFEAHYFECQACALEVRAGAVFEENARKILASRKPSERLREQSVGWLSWLRPNFAYAALAAVLIPALAIQSLRLMQTQQSLEQATAPRVVQASVLRSETRGEPAKVYLESGQPLLLSFDVVAPSGYSRYQFQIKSSTGESVLELIGPAPPVEKPVILSIPEASLSAGRYTLIVRGIPSSAGAGAGSELGQYHFELTK
jgi:hypothetical protein